MTPAEVNCIAIAEAQVGLISRRQACACGMSAKAIRHRVESGRWREIHSRVYQVGPGASTPRRELMAACLWSKGHASHRAAAGIFDLPGLYRKPLEVTVTDIRIQPRCGIIVHFTNRLPSFQKVTVEGFPCTSIERTLLDLGAITGERTVAIAMDDALRRNLTTTERLDGCLRVTARRGRPGVRMLRRLLHQRLDLPEVADTPLESLIFQLLCRSEVLDQPVAQYEIRDRNGVFVARTDFAYPRAKVVVEGQSFAWHSGRAAWERDMERHNRIAALGWLPLYVTWDDVTKAPGPTLRRVEETVRSRPFCS